MTLKKAGRRKEILEETVRKCFNITASQSSWIYEEAAKNNMTDSKFMRSLLARIIPVQPEEVAMKEGA